MSYKLQYHPDIKKVDLPRIDARNRARIKKAIEERLVHQPEVYGRPLQRTLKGYWKLRVGDYRVVFRISGDTLIILGIIHRKTVYSQVAIRE